MIKNIADGSKRRAIFLHLLPWINPRAQNTIHPQHMHQQKQCNPSAEKKRRYNAFSICIRQHVHTNLRKRVKWAHTCTLQKMDSKFRTLSSGIPPISFHAVKGDKLSECATLRGKKGRR